MENPYVYGPVIGIRGTFIGRKKEIKKIFERIRRGESKSLVGDRKMGKSSLLYHLTLEEVQEEYLNGAKWRHIIVYFDCQEKFKSDELTEDELLDMLFETALTAMNDLPEKSDFERTYRATEMRRQGFQNAIAMLSGRKVQLTYLLDEFELITRQENLHDETIDFLRSMANNPNHLFAYVTATQTSLRELCEADKIRSPFWNIFTPLQLGLMPKQEALDIVRFGGEDFCSDVKEFVLEKAGCHPYLIQMMCSILFDLRNRDAGFEQSHFDEGLRAFRSESREHFEGCWQRYLDDEDKRTLKQILAKGKAVKNSFGDVRKVASMSKLPAETQRRAETSIKRGYLEYIDGKCRIFSSLFEDFVRDMPEPRETVMRRRFLPYPF